MDSHAWTRSQPRPRVHGTPRVTILNTTRQGGICARMDWSMVGSDPRAHDVRTDRRRKNQRFTPSTASRYAMGIATSIKKKLRGSGTNLSDTSTGVTGSMAATATAVKDVPASQGWGWLKGVEAGANEKTLPAPGWRWIRRTSRCETVPRRHEKDAASRSKVRKSNIELIGPITSMKL